jgi:hypothetical protein
MNPYQPLATVATSTAPAALDRQLPADERSAKPAPLDREEAHRLCRNVLAHLPPEEKYLLLEVDAHTASLIVTAGAQPIAIWSLGLDGLEEDRAIADALRRARLGFLRGSFKRGLVVSGRTKASSRRTHLLSVLAHFLGLVELATGGETAAVA